ncbi:TMEM175 family protein [Alloacidobacterium sp.]|uniref:TMEM175 family protein n=1 Tax=Alloacidobacterium sp. TaxID=2951999 RepID=UPI002D2A9676|nr:TMEM175 family protein [Alloacidobacterium sp.]HYK37652.1 TMEM175 family protein [Alloacidobacterium sp.]
MADTNAQMSTARLEAFSDGVIAVIITIMVLELHVPHENGWAGLWSVVPRLSVYALSFLMVGIYWINHHELVRRTEFVDYRVLWANLIFLFVLSLVPFVVDYLDEKNFDTFSTLLYDATMVAAGMAFLLLRWSVMRRQWYAGSLQRRDMLELWKHGICLAIYVLAIAMAFYRTWLSLVITGLVTLVWVVPEAGMKEHSKAARAENTPIE